MSWSPVKDQLYYRQAITAFKYMTGQAPEYLTSQFITREQALTNELLVVAKS